MVFDCFFHILFQLGVNIVRVFKPAIMVELRSARHGADSVKTFVVFVFFVKRKHHIDKIFSKPHHERKPFAVAQPDHRLGGMNVELTKAFVFVYEMPKQFNDLVGLAAQKILQRFVVARMRLIVA